MSAPSIDVKDILSLPEFEEHARRHLPPIVWEYLSAGAADELTLKWNRESYDRIRLRPRMMRGINHVDTSLQLFGKQLRSPILLAPTAYHRAIHPDGEIATAKAASAAGVTWVVSTGTNTRLDEIAKVATSPLWFQLYVQADRSLTKNLVQHAEEVGCEAICVTVDTANQGTRNRQTRAKFALPQGIHAPYMGELNPAGGGRPITDNRRGALVTWDDVAWLRTVTRVPILLKGLLDGDEARQAAEAGVSGIIVSNHGARNLDTVPATIDALPEVVERVDGRVPVLVDGGIRRGTDIVKALALGATAVLIGRPYCFGLAVAGAAGVERVIEILQTELEMTMQLMGQRTLADIDRSALWDSTR